MLVRTTEFDRWLDGLRDVRGKVKILTRLNHAEKGNFGECRPIGDGFFEMKIDFGPGYRLYCKRIGSTVYLLLMAGDKASQRRDILHAKEIFAKLPKENGL